MSSTDEFEPNLEIKRKNEIKSYENKNKKKIANYSKILDDIFVNEVFEKKDKNICKRNFLKMNGRITK